MAAYDGISLRLRLTYKGTRAARLPGGRSPGVLEGVELENEEAAAFAGLRNFRERIAADHKEILLRDDRITIRLVYEL